MKLTRSTLEYWALVAEIVGGLAVVISIIYLAVQVSENTRVLRSQAHYNALSLAQRPFEMAIENDSLSKILNVCFSTPDKLSDEEWIRCSDYLFMQMNAWEYLYYQNRDGLSRKNSGLAQTRRSSRWLRPRLDTRAFGRSGTRLSMNRFGRT